MGQNRTKAPQRVPKKESDDDLASLLLQCRAQGNLSLEEVGQAVGITKKAVSNIELRLSRPRRTTRLLLEAFLRARGFSPRSEAA